MARRERGEGSLFYDERKELYVGSISLGLKPDGTRDRRTVYAKTRPECRDALRRLKESAKKAPEIAGTAQTLRDYLRFWLGAIKTAGCKPKTHECYESTVEKHLIPYIGSVKLSEVTAYHAHQLFSALDKDNASTYTQRYAHRVLRSALSYAVEPLKALPANPLFGVKAPSHVARKFTAWTPEQCRVFLTSAECHKLFPAFVIAIDLGLREGEILGLQWSDVDLAQGTLTVNATLNVVKGHILGRGEPKTKSSVRTLPLTPRVVAALRRQRARLMEAGLAACPWVLPTTNGKATNPSNFIRLYKRAVLAVGLPYIRFHDLRHTHATILVQSGVDPKAVSERLGHSSVTTTLQTYVHSDLKQQRDITDRFAKIMDDNGTT